MPRASGRRSAAALRPSRRASGSMNLYRRRATAFGSSATAQWDAPSTVARTPGPPPSASGPRMVRAMCSAPAGVHQWLFAPRMTSVAHGISARQDSHCSWLTRMHHPPSIATRRPPAPGT